MRKVLLMLATVGILAGGCPMMGCTAVHTNDGIVFDVADGAVRYEFTSEKFTATADFDPKALAERALNDAAEFVGVAIGHIRSLFTARAPRTTVGT